MPNYWYRCVKCGDAINVMLSISTDPKELLKCECNGDMKRIIRPGATIPKEVGKVFAGDWFKKTYGHDIGEAYEDKANQKKSREKLEEELRKRQT